MMDQNVLPHLNSSDRSALHEFKSRLQQQLGDRIEHMWLFGSKVRGDADSESDIDLLIVAHSADWTLEKTIARLAFEVDLAHGTVLSPHVVPQHRYVQMKTWREPLYSSIMAEGVDLWTLEQVTTI
jgi:predicted nucleotidyltransferase